MLRTQVHRDLKPANCLLNLEAGLGSTKVIRAKVADFGLSRFMQTTSNNKRSKADLLSSSKNDEETKTKPEEMSRIMTAGQGTGKIQICFPILSHMHSRTTTQRCTWLRRLLRMRCIRSVRTR